MYGTTTGKDVYNHLLKAPKDFNLSLEKMSGFHSDGAPAMTKKKQTNWILSQIVSLG